MVKEEPCKVDDLPSRKIYNHFKRGNQECKDISSWEKSIVSILQGKWKENWGFSTCATKIANTWCLLTNVITEKEDQPLPSPQPCKEELCNFFYFWLGSELEGKLKSTFLLKDVIQKIYNTLEGSNNEPCAQSFLSSTMSTEFLYHRKKVFDYYHDYRTIWKQIKHNSQSGMSSSCTTAYDTYLNGDKKIVGDGGAKDAYNQVSANCGSETQNHDDFCRKFWDKLKNGEKKIPEPSKLKEQAQSGAGPQSDGEEEGEEETNLTNCLTQLLSQPSELAAPPSLPQQVEGSAASPSSRSITPIVSSALSVVGLPALGFLLYKYTNLFSDLRNNLLRSNDNISRIRRKKRATTTTIEHNIDTLTESDSIITTDSTLGDSTFESTINDSTIADSTTDLSTTEDASIIYNELPLRRRAGSRKNNSNMKREQQQQRIQRNISYGRM
ncbi:KIR protein [Plasmodium coatneyi]|uniref:KIR protein n=1 Tax=Plasmodium coatneyi TaxID=208452 RepID=A0A1B1E4Z4_9APIC|nr:KIR protein [Plasmodium coatneyi]ANQ10065.1 KIR protein [Plasmodium coatneyi]